MSIRYCLLITVTLNFQEKQEQLNQFSGEQVLRGEEFKRYVNKLRGKSSVYKMKRAEISELRAEYGILSRTQEILQAKDAQILEQLVSFHCWSEMLGWSLAFISTKDTI